MYATETARGRIRAWTALPSPGGAWFAFATVLAVMVPLWLLTVLVTEVSEHVERCSHGMIGPGGEFRVEGTVFPYDDTCVYPDGTELSAIGALAYVWWFFQTVLLLLLIGAFALEFAHLRRPGSRRRFGVLTAVSGALVVVAYALTSPPVLSCRPSETAARTAFPPQTTCSGPLGTRDLVPGWLPALITVLLPAFAASATGTAWRRRAGRGRS
ncbi:hypothetical protein [Streptomyces sp. NPDC058701]|uniref:hypothetical protein n=1 Tax=Streptomyces sp. NPDC058701 TaxID=3346608 RepID=UPI00365ACE34